NGSQTTLLTNLGSSATSYQVTGLTPATTVSFYVKAYNGSVIANSATRSVTLPLAAPALTASAASPTAVNPSWGTDGQAAGYKVFQVNGTQTTLITTLGSSATSYQVTGRTPGNSPSFYVQAYKGSVTANSATVSVTLPLAKPTVKASAASPTAVNLSWGAVAQASGYKVYRVNGTQTTLVATLASSTTSYQVTGLTPGPTVSFYVQAYNGSVIANSATVSVTLPSA